MLRMACGLSSFAVAVIVPDIHCPLACSNIVSTDTFAPSALGFCITLSPCLVSGSRTADQQDARSEYLLLKNGFAAFLCAPAISACAKHMAAPIWSSSGLVFISSLLKHRPLRPVRSRPPLFQATPHVQGVYKLRD